ncbi:MAG TPA: hypothetical protein VFG44_09400 [Burkholderiales bacterium]|jgi:hypothetical protein|nr:hypothetical protein [Burkholderiales bacterium]
MHRSIILIYRGMRPHDIRGGQSSLLKLKQAYINDGRDMKQSPNRERIFSDRALGLAIDAGSSILLGSAKISTGLM